MQTMSGIKRKVSYGKTFNYMVKEFDSHDELYRHLKKGDKVLVQERVNDDIYLMTVAMKEAGNGMIVFKDDVKEIATSKEFTCHKVYKIMALADK